MPTKTLQSLERGIDLLFLFSADRPVLPLHGIAQALDLPESTAYRLVATLCKKGVLARSTTAKGYELHASLLRLLAGVRVHKGIGDVSRPHLEVLARESGETAQLSVLHGNEIVCAEAVSTPNMIRYMPERGRALPLHASALGRVVLAFLPEAFLQTYIEKVGLKAMTPHTVTDARKLRTILARVRAQRWAMSFQQMYPGARGVAVPIFDHGGEVVASLGISGPDPRFSGQKARSFVPSLHSHAKQISEGLGAVPDDSPS